MLIFGHCRTMHALTHLQKEDNSKGFFLLVECAPTPPLVDKADFVLAEELE